MTSNIHEQSQNLRQNFRKQIRRRQIQQIFTTKRRINTATCISQIQKTIQNSDLNYLLDQVKSQRNLYQTIGIIGQNLFTQDYLIKQSQKSSVQNIQYILIQLTHTIFNLILPNYSSNVLANCSIRVRSLAMLCNLLADKLAPLNHLIPIVSEGLQNCYGSIKETTKKQAAEIGWIVSNIFTQEMDLSERGDLARPLEYLLGIADEILIVQASEFNVKLVPELYKSLTRFYEYVDYFFKEKAKKQEINVYDGRRGATGFQQIQHFKTQRLILIEQTIFYCLNWQMGTTLINVIDFLLLNLNYILTCHQQHIQSICAKCMSIISRRGSQKIIRSNFQLVKKLVVKRNVAIKIVKDHFDVLTSCLLHDSATIKILALNLIQKLIFDEEILIFMVQSKQLEQTLKAVVQVVRAIDVQKQAIQLTKIMLDLSHQKYGIKVLKAIEDTLTNKQGEIGNIAIKIVQNYDHKMQQID